MPAKPLTVGLDGRLTGEAIMAHAKALGCDLLIKGAYTQSRLRQIIFGGTTALYPEQRKITGTHGALIVKARSSPAADTRVTTGRLSWLLRLEALPD